uniref:Uncharacterized protein n=1 Tax=Arundo donax TaxID=35708 RepID=A0A0A8ZMA4_ARUDO
MILSEPIRKSHMHTWFILSVITIY